MPRFPAQAQRSPEKSRPSPLGGNTEISEHEPPPTRPMVRRQPSEVKVRGPPPEPPAQQKQMPLVSSLA